MIDFHSVSAICKWLNGNRCWFDSQKRAFMLLEKLASGSAAWFDSKTLLPVPEQFTFKLFIIYSPSIEHCGITSSL